MSKFKDTDEFKRIFEQIFELMNEHPEVARRCGMRTPRTGSRSPTSGSSSTSRPRLSPTRRRDGT